MTSDISTIIASISNCMAWIFVYEWIAVFAAIIALFVIMIKFKVDRFAMVFVMVTTLGTFAYYGQLDSAIFWGLTLIGGGILTFYALRSIFARE